MYVYSFSFSIQFGSVDGGWLRFFVSYRSVCGYSNRTQLRQIRYQQYDNDFYVLIFIITMIKINLLMWGYSYFHSAVSVRSIHCYNRGERNATHVIKTLKKSMKLYCFYKVFKLYIMIRLSVLKIFLFENHNKILDLLNYHYRPFNRA